MTTEMWQWPLARADLEELPIALDESGYVSARGLWTFIDMARWIMSDETQGWLCREWTGSRMFVDMLRRLFGVNVGVYLRLIGRDADEFMDLAYETRGQRVNRPCAEHAGLDADEARALARRDVEAYLQSVRPFRGVDRGAVSDDD